MSKGTAIAVIGAGYGDEGKGLLVDAFAAASDDRPTVVRTNGGAQAGHTVVLADGRRHVFHHIGSGALAGAATHLSRFFVHHPMLFDAERQSVADLGGSVTISADPRGLVTTPWDVLINQVAERCRGSARHGSCGLGFGETIERGLHPAFRLTLRDLTQPRLRDRLDSIRRSWAPARLAALGIGTLLQGEAELFADDRVLAAFHEDCQHFIAHVAPASDGNLRRRGPVIFEGAQGLLLDQSIGTFPHVTRSHTGLVNMMAVAREAQFDAIDAVYVTRAYATRHGAGPLPLAALAPDEFDIVDPTNAPNPWQGRMRTAPLDLDQLVHAIAADRRLADPGTIRLRTGIAMTCLDQARGRVTLVAGGELRRHAADDLSSTIARRLDQPLLAESRGPCRSDIALHTGALAVAA